MTYLVVLDGEQNEAVGVLLEEVFGLFVLGGLGLGLEDLLGLGDHRDALDRDGDFVRSDEVLLVVGCELGLGSLALERRLHLEVTDGVGGLE